ncbi:MAG: 16S rRNA (guanine(966)-N(2))-methyltransferase RsmD [Clostridiales bacterium]|nr:16S rRNA (guanine(966)-N(2))-methyltransferase RsmD [Clostridiales bacterium]
MRVIAGKARRIQLTTVDGDDTRPTTDRIKETLFNMIAPDMYECMFLDLFSGSGGIGIEAVSRGAKMAYFVENNRAASLCIKKNISVTHFEEQCVLMECDVLTAIERLESKVTFDYIFMDPPYNQLIEKNILEKLSQSDIINEDSVIIVEASLDTKMDYLEDLGFELIKKKIYKTNYHAFIQKA